MKNLHIRIVAFIYVTLFINPTKSFTFTACCCQMEKDTFRGFTLQTSSLIKLSLNSHDLISDKLKISERLFERCQDLISGLPTQSSLLRIDVNSQVVNEQICQAECKSEEIDMNDGLEQRIETYKNEKYQSIQQSLMKMKSLKMKLIRRRVDQICSNHKNQLEKSKLRISINTINRNSKSVLRNDHLLPKLNENTIASERQNRFKVIRFDSELINITPIKVNKSKQLNRNSSALSMTIKSKPLIAKSGKSSFGVKLQIKQGSLPALESSRLNHNRNIGSRNYNMQDYNLEIMNLVDPQKDAGEILQTDELINDDLRDAESISSSSDSLNEDQTSVNEIENLIMNYEVMLHYLKDKKRKPVDIILKSYNIPSYVLERMIKLYKFSLFKEEKMHEQYLRNLLSVKDRFSRDLGQLKPKEQKILIRYKKKHI